MTDPTRRRTTQSTAVLQRPPYEVEPHRPDPARRLRHKWRWKRVLLRRPVIATVTALAGLIVSYRFGGVLENPRHRMFDEIVAIAGAVAFLVAAVIAVRGATDDLLARVPRRIGDARISAFRLLCILTGYILVGMAALSLLHVPVTHLLLGGVLTGVILGIAAQQALGNTFAGLVLLFARPFTVGNDVTIRSGALGGGISGTVTGMTLTYVSLRTDDGPVLLPNSAVLTAAIGPGARWKG